MIGRIHPHSVLHHGIPLVTQHYRLLSRCLIYTGLTRTVDMALMESTWAQLGHTRTESAHGMGGLLR